ncbi:MAG: iron-sulfur cluster repair di-iron protein [Ginsengibacter sp.]
MTNIAEQTLASMVTGNHQVVPLLEKYNLDFCCKGKRTLAQACAEKGIKIESITEELKSLTDAAGKGHMPFTEMNAEQMISYILIHHHFYVKQSMPTIFSHLHKVATKHGDKFPYMKKVYDLFVIIMREMTLHMEKEESALFPRIKEAERLYNSNRSSEILSGYITVPVEAMEADHEEAGDIMYQIRTLTNNYTPPQDACTTFKVTLEELKEFEEDLHRHVHLENNILFPKAIQYEKN